MKKECVRERIEKVYVRVRERERIEKVCVRVCVRERGDKESEREG